MILTQFETVWGAKRQFKTEKKPKKTIIKVNKMNEEELHKYFWKIHEELNEINKQVSDLAVSGEQFDHLIEQRNKLISDYEDVTENLNGFKNG